jgi:hypothetical protein
LSAIASVAQPSLFFDGQALEVPRDHGLPIEGTGQNPCLLPATRDIAHEVNALPMFLVRCECPANDLGSKRLLTNVREYPQEMRRLLPRIILIVSLAVSNPDQGPPRPPSTRLPASLQHKLAAKDRPDHPMQECWQSDA